LTTSTPPSAYFETPRSLLTTRRLTDGWCAECGVKADDATWAILRNRIGACLTALQHKGLAAGVGTMVDGYKGWRRTP
jgi:hypothetical protein